MFYFLLLLVPFVSYKLRDISNNGNDKPSFFEMTTMLSMFAFSVLVPFKCIYDFIQLFEPSNENLYYSLSFGWIGYFVVLIMFIANKKKIEQ